MHVTDAHDVRRVSVLKATSLIEASIDPAFDPGGNYRLAQAALVVCITDEGYAEIARMRGHGDETPSKPPKPAKKKSLEPMAYLHRIEHSPFPLRVEEPEEINCIEALKQAGFVDASISPALNWKDGSAPRELAIVRRITPFGRAALVRGKWPPPAAATR
ncbi:hypothetical protein DBV14_13295 [Variovorax sp. KBW07]|uniref:hypothetical protein n=1 Tax=Variovorax sp. KBW07 TaxID=2153358 RepID=UPI000F579B89|nr:hypothetical protein [Variovorax sp. KBW07]RQO53754.1 hypothetical protein DBV14_13295 [Variovorax sp. KBW07]